MATVKEETYGHALDGQVVTEDMVERLAAQAEIGFENVPLVRRGGRPLIGAAAANVRTLRLPPELDTVLVTRAKEERTTPSYIMREALMKYFGFA